MWETWVRSLGWEDSPGEGNSYPLQYSDLENSVASTAHGVANSGTLSTVTFTFNVLTNYQTQSKHFCPKQRDEKYYMFCAQVQHEGLEPPSSNRAPTPLQAALTVTTSRTLPRVP